jgi:hypothetical protein
VLPTESSPVKDSTRNRGSEKNDGSKDRQVFSLKNFCVETEQAART